MALTRRSFIQAAGSGLGAAALGIPVIARAQAEPIRVGLMTVKTGPLASGGLDMERGDPWWIANVDRPGHQRDACARSRGSSGDGVALAAR